MVQPKKKSFKQTIIINLRELELREVKQLFRGHTARKEWSWDLNPRYGCCAAERVAEDSWTQ